jgi:glycosyltransferase involved in cell wall biosynthesis
MILLVHPTGNTFSRALLAALQGQNQLGLFATTIAFSGQETFLKFLPQFARAELLRRRFDVPGEKLFTRPLREALRLSARFIRRRPATHHEVYRVLDTALARRLRRLRRKHSLTAVYAYEDGALELFRRAKTLGLKRHYDLPIAYWETSKRLLWEEAERWPDWLGALDFEKGDSARKTEEAELADTIICPSKFVQETLPENLRSRAVVAEFGSPIPEHTPQFRAPADKIRILFAGAMTQRKGLADLFAAMKLLRRKDIELVVMGSPLVTMRFYRHEFADFIHEPPRPHSEFLKLMETCDALVLPSIVEGRALVQQEAMSRGLILIATKNAGAEDLIEDGRAGFLIPIRSPEAIAEKLNWLAENRAALPEMKRAAFEKASALTWNCYAQKILRAINADA